MAIVSNVEELKNALQDDKEIFLRGGTYFLDSPLELRHKNLRIRACAHQNPVISGGRKLNCT